MEIYAGFLEQADHEAGRLVEAIADLGVLDDTLITTSSATTGPRRRAPRTVLQRDVHPQRHGWHRDP